jgi:hypothetical protein
MDLRLIVHRSMHQSQAGIFFHIFQLETRKNQSANMVSSLDRQLKEVVPSDTTDTKQRNGLFARLNICNFASSRVLFAGRAAVFSVIAGTGTCSFLLHWLVDLI